MDGSRRGFLAGSVAAGGAAMLPASAYGQVANAPLQSLPPPPPGQKTAPKITPNEALKRLVDGNRAFLADRSGPMRQNTDRRLALTTSQEPFVAYVSCSDSRVPPELLFGRGLGEMFIIRNAGNTVDTVALGSIEYAVAVLGVPLVVVMGHQSCGAVKAALDVVDDNAVFPGVIGRMIEPIIPAVLQSRGKSGDKLENAVRANVSRVVRLLRTATDPIMLAPQAEGRLRVVGAYYSFETGAVDFFDQG